MRHVTLRILSGLVLLAAIAGIAFLAYNAGAAHQAVVAPQAQVGQTGSPTYPFYGPFWWPFPFWGFGFFGLIAAFFLFWLAFGALRFVLWGPRFGWRRWHRGYGYWGERGEGEEYPIPPMMAELHRRMHAADESKPAGQPPKNQA
jgi:hypothetical protein